VDRINNMMENMAELSDEQIVELQNEIVNTFESVESEEPTPQTVEAMTSLADMLDSVRSEVKRREVQAEELAAQVSEASARVHGENMSEEDAIDQNPEDTEIMEPNEGTPEEEAKDKAEGETPEEAKKEEEKPMMASAETEEVEESTAVEEVEELSTEEAVELSVEEGVEVPAVQETSETQIDVPEEVQEETVEATTVTAAIDAQDVTPEVPADRRLTSDATAVSVAITAGADIPGLTAGTELSNMSDVAEAFAKRLHGLRRVNGGDGEQHIVASFSTAYPDAVQLGSDAEANMSKIDSVTGKQALVASGGYQSPYAVRYDIFGLGSNVRPIRDSLPTFQTDRGGIRFIVPPSLAGASAATYNDAVGVWTQTIDTSTSNGVATATKGNLVVTAATETTAVADAVTLQLQFGNLATRAYPELIARHNELALIQHAREAEAELVSKINAGSIKVTTANQLGVGVDFLLQVGRASAHYRGRHRMDENAPLRVIAPFWVKAAIRADFALQMPGDNSYAVTDAQIDSYLAARHVNVTWTMDTDTDSFANIPSGSEAAISEFKDAFDWYMFAEGTFLFLDGGTLDIGIIRDSTLVGTNDYRMFVETFEGIAKVGVESLRVRSVLQVNGARAALRDTLAGSASATLEF
jgi:chemotaxis protein histidine kinase CheA